MKGKRTKGPESGNRLVVKANRLIEAKYRLTASEQKIIFTLISMVEKDDEDFKRYFLNIRELSALLDTGSHSKYGEVKEIAVNLMKEVFAIHDVDKKEEIYVAWFASVNYMYGKGLVEFLFSPYLKPLMLRLKENFTQFKLSEVMQLRSMYSIRLYELLKQYEPAGKRVIYIDDLRELISIPQGGYPLYADFKRRVLLQAEKEINQKTDITFTFKEIKESRRVIAIEFKICPVLTGVQEPEEGEGNAGRKNHLTRAGKIAVEVMRNMVVETG
jgi:plasmid replication initiation protein